MAKEHEQQVRSWGFGHAFTWTDAPSIHYPPHSHATLMTHLIIEGEMTLWYPREEDTKKTTYGVGARIDVDAGRIHEVIIGSKGCTYVIGE